jgi:hypothetical protein
MTTYLKTTVDLQSRIPNAPFGNEMAKSHLYPYYKLGLKK